MASRPLLVAIAAAASLAGCRAEPAAEPAQPAPSSTAHPPDRQASTPDPVGPAPAPVPASQFSSLETEDCRTVARNIDEGGYVRQLCPGSGGYRLELIESDARQSLVLRRPGGGRDALSFAALAGGGGFSTIGPTAEWRGIDPAQPRTLTVRFKVNEDPDPKVPPRSYLIVIGLAKRACPVALVPPGPTQSADARRIADAPSLPPCLSVTRR